MSGQFDVHLVSANIGALTNALQPLVKLPSGGGSIKVLSANYTPGATSGTASLQLLDLGTAGTAIGGTVGDWGTVTASAKVPSTCTLVASPVLPEGHWIGVKETNVGSTPTVSIVSFSYVMGR